MERTLLVIIEFDRSYQARSRAPAAEGAFWPIEDEQRELEELARSAGSQIVQSVLVRRHTPIARTLMGSGKLDEIHDIAHAAKAQSVIVNQELSPTQQRNVEDILGVKTIDRTQLILDIFAQRAKSQEGKVQVELAQLRYLLPRLSGKGVLLSRLGGGIGTRGPGEQKLEVDRRRIRERITRLSRELKQLASRREATRQRRREAQVPILALVGYTNAGKSTLLNQLTGAEARAENRPFTTLDPLARRLRLPSGREAILTDTVGFLHRLPHHLIEAFRSTLEEAQDAAILLHVLDASHPLALEQAEAVRNVLDMLELRNKPTITVLNKRDQVADAARLAELSAHLPSSIAVSALKRQGIGELLQRLDQQLLQAAQAVS